MEQNPDGLSWRGNIAEDPYGYAVFEIEKGRMLGTVYGIWKEL
jgi:hypothetical protein